MAKRWKAFTEPFSTEEQGFHWELTKRGMNPIEANKFLREVYDYAEQHIRRNEEDRE
jgi:hypothetical protein